MSWPSWRGWATRFGGDGGGHARGDRVSGELSAAGRAFAGIAEREVRELLGRIPLMHGAERLFRTLKRMGYKTAILSGGFTFSARTWRRF